MKTDGLRVSLLLEFYGNLLTERQREIVAYYYDEDLSLAEISELTGITRQGVRDALVKGELMLEEYEKNLLMYESYQKRLFELGKLKIKLLSFANGHGVDPEDAELSALIGIIDGMQQ